MFAARMPQLSITTVVIAAFTATTGCPSLLLLAAEYNCGYLQSFISTVTKYHDQY